MKRSGSLDLFIYLWGRALAAQTTSRAHPATTRPGLLGAVQRQKQSSGVTWLCGAPEAQPVGV